MKEHQDISINRNDSYFPSQEKDDFDYLRSPKEDEKSRPEKIKITGEVATKTNVDNFLVGEREPKITNESSSLLIRKNPETDVAITGCQNSSSLFRLFVKNGEFVYARPNDIILIESCDHMVKVHLAFNDKIKKTVRNNTLKDFLLLLPQHQFMRIGRFCAVNMHRLSGGNCNEQTFEFDFKVSVKLKHAVPNTVFNGIGR